MHRFTVPYRLVVANVAMFLNDWYLLLLIVDLPRTLPMSSTMFSVGTPNVSVKGFLLPSLVNFELREKVRLNSSKIYLKLSLERSHDLLADSADEFVVTYSRKVSVHTFHVYRVT